jgi:hypothetical protein
MENMIIAQRGQDSTKYIKFLYTPEDWGIGVSLFFDRTDHTLYGWEFTLHIFCFQMWIGG